MSAEAIIVFDGVCVLCSGWVRFLLRYDRKERYRFAAMQSDSGARLLQQHGLDPADPASFLLLDSGVAWQDSDAILRVLTGLGGPWRLASIGRIVPRPLRDALYRFIARRRYRIFGKHDVCLLPDPRFSGRFLT